MPLDRPLPDDTREALKMLWSVTEEQLIDINRHRDSLHKIWHVPPVKPREGLLIFADGVDWNPGSGAGYYEYVGGAWVFMGGGGVAGPAGPPGATGPAGPAGPAGASTIIQEEGVPLTSRTVLNFIGTSVTAADDAANSRTNVTITGASQTPWLSNIDGAGFTLLNVGTIGIGTSTPSCLLSLGPGFVNLKLAVYDDGSTLLGFGAAAGMLRYYTASNCNHAFFHSTTELMRVEYTGNVGIGTLAPVRRLHVAGAALDRAMCVTGGAPSIIMAGPADTEPSAQSMATMWMMATAAGHFGLGLGDAAIVQVGTSRGNLVLNANYSGGGANRHVVLQPAGGNVGIGTATPTSKLSVVGLPTASAGLAAGDIWMDAAAGRVLKIV